MRAHQEQSDPDTLVYIDVKKIVAEPDGSTEIDFDEDVIEEIDIEEIVRVSQATIPPQAPTKGRSRYLLAIVLMLTGLASLALLVNKRALGGAMARLERAALLVRSRLGAPASEGALASSAPATHELRPVRALTPVVGSPALSAPTSTPQPAADPSRPRADATLDRRNLPFGGGVFEILPDFASEDGAYDLIVHFHGGASAVGPEFARAKLNAVLVVVNLGISSGPYDQKYTSAVLFPMILSNVARTLGERGLRTPSLRRLAVTAWSAGYAAVKRILDEPEAIERIDAVVLLDGIHTAYLAYPKRPDPSHLEMFVRFAREAIADRKLFSITHSEIDPIDFVSTHKATDLLLGEVGVSRHLVIPQTVSAEPVPAMPSRTVWPMELTSEAHSGGLIVRGYSGEKKEDHLAHVNRMANTALPDLVKRWATVPSTHAQ